jgi:hypothetical protein
LWAGFGGFRKEDIVKAGIKIYILEIIPLSMIWRGIYV